MSSGYSVRDLTTPTQISIHVVILTHWQRLMGAAGFGLYAWYRMMAATRIEMGARQIGALLGMSRTAVRNYTEFFALAGLVQVRSGGPAVANVIEILDPPELDQARLHRLEREVMNHTVLGSSAGMYFRRAILERMESWEPFEIPIGRGAINGGGMAAAPAGPDPALLAGLAAIGFDGAARWLPSADPALVRAWLDAFNAGGYREVKNRAGLLRSSVERGERPRGEAMLLCPRCQQRAPEEYSGICIECMDDLNIKH